MNGRFARSLFAAFTNPAPGVDLERFHRWYFEMHRPDSLGLGLFDRSMRYEAASGSRVRFLTLWAAEYASPDEALARVRPVARELRERGRIWPVQEVVFAQFLQLEAAEDSPRTGDEPPRTLTTVQNDWRTPEPGVGFAAWSAHALPEAEALRGLYAASGGYAAPPDDDPSARRCLWVGESEREAAELAEWWQGRAEPGIAPLGGSTPIFPTHDRPAPVPAPASAPAPGAAGRTAAWVVHWRPVPIPGSEPTRY